MEPENIDWDSIDSTFIEDDAYENFDAPKWVDLTASDELLVDDEAWFFTHDCKHPKTTEDIRKPTTSNSKAKLLRFVTISEVLPFRDRNRSEKASAAKSSYVKSLEKSRRPSCSGNFHEDNENENPNFSGLKSSSGTNKPKKLLRRPKRDDSKHMNLNGSMKYPVKSDRKSQLKGTFSAQNLLGGSRELLNQITGFCSELKRLARIGSNKGATEKSPSGLSEELKETVVDKERVPLLVVKEGRTLKYGTE